MTRLVVRRRRRLTLRWLLVVAVLALVGVVVAVFVGHANQASSSATVASPTTIACHADSHDADGATLTAIEGLHQLSLANIGAADIDATLERYVTPERRPMMRKYLTEHPASFRSIVTTVLAAETIAYTDETAHIRLATSDVAVTVAGQEKASQAITDATVVFDPTQNYWRLADWKVNATPAVADVVAGGQAVPCS